MTINFAPHAPPDTHQLIGNVLHLALCSMLQYRRDLEKFGHGNARKKYVE